MSFSRTGADRVFVFNYASRITTSNYHVNNTKKDEWAKVIPQPAVYAAHADQSSFQAHNVLHKWLPDECEKLLQGRWMICNVSLSAARF
jgi:hypothetical protein